MRSCIINILVILDLSTSLNCVIHCFRLWSCKFTQPSCCICWCNSVPAIGVWQISYSNLLLFLNNNPSSDGLFQQCQDSKDSEWVKKLYETSSQKNKESLGCKWKKNELPPRLKHVLSVTMCDPFLILWKSQSSRMQAISSIRPSAGALDQFSGSNTLVYELNSSIIKWCALPQKSV